MTRAAALNPFGYQLRRGPAGFTLIEMLVVLALISIMAFAVLPRLGTRSDADSLEAMARRIVILAQQAHSQAATETKPWFLAINLDKTEVWLTNVRPSENDNEVFSTGFSEDQDKLRFVDVIRMDGDMAIDGTVSFAFWANGGNEPGTVHLEDPKGREMTLFIRPYLGRVEIKEGYQREFIQ